MCRAAIVDASNRWIELFGDDAEATIAELVESLPENPRRSVWQSIDTVRATHIASELCLGVDGAALRCELLPVPPIGGLRDAVVVRVAPAQPERDRVNLEHLARRNEAILSSAMDGFFVVGDDYRFLEVNAAFCRMTGYSEAELLALKISDLEVCDARDEGVPSHTKTGLHQFSVAHRHKSGRLIYLEISISVLRDDGRKILVGFARDVTERRQAEERFARLSRHHKLILDTVVDGLLGVDGDGVITFANPAAAVMLGAHAADLLVGREADSLCAAGKDGDDARHSLHQALSDGATGTNVESALLRIDGESFPVEFSITRIRETAGKSGAVIVFRDITRRRNAAQERRTLELQMEQAQKLESLGLLAGGIAHDFNNMLVGMLGNACLALEQLPDEDAVRRRVQRIIGACERASKTVHQILAYAGRATCEVSPLDVNELVAEMTDFMRAALPSNIDLAIDLDPAVVQIQADSGQLQQVLTNLIVNASEAIGQEAGSIRIRTELIELSESHINSELPGRDLKPGSFVGMRVTDSGCGMTAATAARIFDPFFSRKGAGRGLGLAATHGIIRAHGGGIRVDSAPRAGTTFTVVFPVTELSNEISEAPEARAAVCAGATALVIDDEEDVRDVVRMILENRGCRVLLAEDGARGIDVFREHADEVDVVLLDMTMPGMGGAEVFKRIVAIRPDARVVISSGYSEQDIRARFDDAPRLAGFVHKPYTADALVESLSEVVARSPAAR